MASNPVSNLESTDSAEKNEKKPREKEKEKGVVDLRKKIDSDQKAYDETTDLGKFLAGLGEDLRPGDEELLNDFERNPEKYVDKTKNKDTIFPVQERAANEYIRGVLPQVVNNLNDLLDIVSTSEYFQSRDRDDILEQIEDSLKLDSGMRHLLDFESLQLGHEFGAQEAIYLAALIHIMVNNGSYRDVLIKKGKELKYDQSFTHKTNEQVDKVISIAERQAIQVADLMFIKYANRDPKTLEHLPTDFDFWLRRLNPEEYRKYEDEKYGIDKYTRSRDNT